MIVPAADKRVSSGWFRCGMHKRTGKSKHVQSCTECHRQRIRWPQCCEHNLARMVRRPAFAATNRRNEHTMKAETRQLTAQGAAV